MTLVIVNKTCIAPGHLNSYAKQTVVENKMYSEIIVYNLSQQKRFFVDVTLKSSMAHYRLLTFDYFATFSSSKRHPNRYLVV